jgi:MFS family permease
VTIIFIAFLVIGIAMPVLPLRVHHDLGLGTFYVGLVAGAQFSASLLSRFWAGNHVDLKGAKQAIFIGLSAASLSGLLYLLSLCFVEIPGKSMAVMLAGRALLGWGESFIIMGTLSLGLVRVGAQNSGQVMSWVGTAMYVAYALGAPAGTALYSRFGFTAIALATTLTPLAALLILLPLPKLAPQAKARPSIRKVIGAVWIPGLGLALSSVGFGAITIFIVLLFAKHGWNNAWGVFTLVSVAFMMGRVTLGHLPDKIGGAKVALCCVLIEAVGQAMIWLAPWSWLAFAGAALTGLGYSLVYPGLGVEAIRLAPPGCGSMAMGAFTAFLDLALGVAGPVLGFIAGQTGIDSVFLVSTLVVLCSALVGVFLLRSGPAILTAK